MSLPFRAYTQIDGEDHGAQIFGGVYTYGLVNNSVPLYFWHHHVDYETLYQENILSPVHFDCRVVGPKKGKPFKQDLVIPNHIRIGIHTLIPIEIANGAFQQTDVTSLKVKADIRTIPQSAFMFCAELESVEFNGHSPHFIEGNAFRSCLKLRSVSNLPANLQYIGEQAFSQCIKLETFHFPKDVAFIGEGAFSGCISLRSVKFDSGHFRIIPKECFRGCESLTEIEIPEGVEGLADNSFYYSGLKSITLPTTMKVLYNGCLTNTPLEEIRIKATVPPSVGKVFTADVVDRITVYVPASALEAYKSHKSWGYFKNIRAY